ncbi:hypothetical protein [Microbacterium jejuense]|uniref:hypothetical protein n=1 Tax=Microbacterium jejuense TaxID=1263637 RepID=UPI0031EF82E9
MTHLLRAAAGLAVVVVGAATLAGCAVALPTIVGPADSSSQSPTDETTGDDTGIGDLPFDVEFDAATMTLQWTDPFMADANYTVSAADDGNGSWAYTDARTGCVATFYQGLISGLDTSLDDSALTDSMLALVLTSDDDTVTGDDVADYAYDDSLPLTPSGTVDARTITISSDDGTTWLDTARMFGSVGGGIYLGIQCPSGQDATTELDVLIGDGLAAVIVPVH